MNQRAEGNLDVSKIIKPVTLTPTRGTKFRKAISSANQDQIKKDTPSEALAIFVEGDFSRKQWEIIHAANKSIYPCYFLIKKAKTECYPSEEAIRVTETCAVQDLHNHTCLRLCKYLEEVIETCSEEEKVNLKLIVKWGFRGVDVQVGIPRKQNKPFCSETLKLLIPDVRRSSIETSEGEEDVDNDTDLDY
ncbi:unnamed protein product [Euphydryas editha]|uniref:Uncharacterized protein n=1 Tax=Euphydryas editha TaxID=104508 RepID=A0AAU9UDG3_EUPED|nr:unnamed protein product [Euphydryas editha]